MKPCLGEGLVDDLHVVPGVKYFDYLSPEAGDQAGLSVQPGQAGAVVPVPDFKCRFVRKFCLRQFPNYYTVFSSENINVLMEMSLYR